MPDYLFAVQDQNGREVASWKGTVAKVGDVASVEYGDTQKVEIRNVDEVVAEGDTIVGNAYTLHRWPADDKLADPISHPVVAADEG